MNGHDKLTVDTVLEHQRIERDGALARITLHMTNAVGHLRAARHEAHNFGITLDLPSERPFLDAIGACARIHQQAKEKPL